MMEWSWELFCRGFFVTFFGWVTLVAAYFLGFRHGVTAASRYEDSERRHEEADGPVDLERF
jgi:hypothetical protein